MMVVLSGGNVSSVFTFCQFLNLQSWLVTQVSSSVSTPSDGCLAHGRAEVRFPMSFLVFAERDAV